MVSVMSLSRDLVIGGFPTFITLCAAFLPLATPKTSALTPGITGGPNTLKDGKPGEQEDRRVEHIIPVDKVREGKYEVIIEVTCNSMFGLGPYRYQTPDVSTPPSRSLFASCPA
jgi:putative alpha-1,2-mannosidase